MTSMRVRNFLAALLLGVIAILPAPLPALADSIPESARIDGVRGIAQGYSLSCEARSAVDWADFWGVSIRERKFQAKLPRSSNPDAGFVGSPSDPWGDIPPRSYGVHAEPVAALLRDYGLQAEARRGMSWDELRQEIAAGRPVIVWVVGQVWRGTPVKYTAPDGHKTTVARYEHTMIVVGYTSSVVYLVDAYTGQHQTHRLRDFLASWKTLGNMAIVGQASAKASVEAPPASKPEVSPAPAAQMFLPSVLGPLATVQPEDDPEENSEESSEPASPKAYIVRRGDFLVGVARSLGVNWRKLAATNHIGYPYIIYAGQVLKIP